MTEPELVKLFKDYQDAKAELAAIPTEPPASEPLPVPCDIEQYHIIVGRNKDRKEIHAAIRAEVVKKANEAEKAIFAAIPARVWIALPSIGVAIGYETGTWGGSCRTLHIAKIGDELKELPHVTYYP